MVENISEQDYYEKSGDKYTLKGMSIAIILDPKGGTNATLSGRKYRQLRKRNDF